MNHEYSTFIKNCPRTGSVPGQVQATADLLDGGATVPFISRYRKEATGSLDEVAVTAVRDRMGQLLELDQRRESILKAMEERGQLTEALKEKIQAAETLAVLEDIYLPFRPKRRTRAAIAREKGLEPLARSLFDQGEWTPTPRLRPTSIPKREWPQRKRPWPGPETSSPNGSARMKPPGPGCGIISPRKRCSGRKSSRARKRKGSNTGIISTGKSP